MLKTLSPWAEELAQLVKNKPPKHGKLVHPQSQCSKKKKKLGMRDRG